MASHLEKLLKRRAEKAYERAYNGEKIYLNEALGVKNCNDETRDKAYKMFVKYSKEKIMAAAGTEKFDCIDKIVDNILRVNNLANVLNSAVDTGFLKRTFPEEVYGSIGEYLKDLESLNELYVLTQIYSFGAKRGFDEFYKSCVKTESGHVTSLRLCYDGGSLGASSYTVKNKIKVLSAFNKLRRIKALSLTRNYFLENIDFLKDLKQLEELDISDTDTDDISCFKNFKELRRLSMHRTKIHDISVLRELKNLRHLTVDQKQCLNDDNILNELREKGVEICVESSVRPIVRSYYYLGEKCEKRS